MWLAASNENEITGLVARPSQKESTKMEAQQNSGTATSTKSELIERLGAGAV